MGSHPILCIFCGNKRPSSKEHVIPRWVRTQLALTSEVSTEVNAKTVHSRPNLYIALDRKICTECNNTWLSDLEKAVKPFLSPMLTHKHAVWLDLAQQRDLARWATIKVLLLELATRQQHSRQRPGLAYVPSQVELAWLANKADPPPRSRVWLGAFDAEGELAVSFQARLLGTDSPGSTPADAPSSHVTTLTIGQVLLQVFSTDFVSADSIQLPQFDLKPGPPIDQALVRLWPVRHAAIQWPGSVYVDKNSLPMVIKGRA